MVRIALRHALPKFTKSFWNELFGCSDKRRLWVGGRGCLGVRKGFDLGSFWSAIL